MFLLALIPTALWVAGAPAANAVQVAKTKCSQWDPTAKTGYCFQDAHGGVFWLGTMTGYDGKEIYCIDYYYDTKWGVAHHTTQITGDLLSSIGSTAPHGTVAALNYLVTQHPADTANDTTAAAISLIIRQIQGDVKESYGQPIPGGLRVSTQVKDVPFVSQAVIDRARDLWSQAVAHRGPWQLSVHVNTGADGTVTPGQKVTATVKGTNGAGDPQAMTVALSYQGFTGPSSVSLGADGTATITLTAPSSPGTAKVTGSVSDAPSDSPTVIVPNNWSTNPHPGNHYNVTQRGLVGRQATVKDSDAATVAVVYSPSVATQTSATEVTPGTAITDTVKISGAAPNYSGPVTATLYGPFASKPGSGSCSGAPVAGSVQLTVSGNGTYTTPPVTVSSLGYYTWVEKLPGTSSQNALTTACGQSTETTLVTATPAPTVITTASADQVTIGAPLSDTVQVSGAAAGYDTDVTATLVGPFPAAPVEGSCDTTTGPVAGSVTFHVTGDGTYTTPTVTPTQTGYYTWVESFPATNGVGAFQTTCGVSEETTLVSKATPNYVTQISNQSTAVGDSVSDTITVSGLIDGQSLDINWALYGPYASRDAMDCAAAPVASGTVTATSNGSVTTPNYSVTQPGLYTFTESSASTDSYEAYSTTCGQAEETTTAKIKPTVITTTSAPTVKVGASITDTVKVSGTGPGYSSQATAHLYGPYASAAAATCKGAPYATVSFAVNGDGTYTTPGVKLADAGYYTWVETLPGDDLTAAVQTICGEVSETSKAIGTPKVITQTSDARTSVGSSITDTVKVSGTGPGYKETVTAHLYGPYASAAAATCATKPVGTVKFTATGDGTYTTPAVHLTKAGYYTWVETLPGDDLTAAVKTICGTKSETTLAIRTYHVPPHVSVPAGPHGTDGFWSSSHWGSGGLLASGGLLLLGLGYGVARRFRSVK